MLEWYRNRSEQKTNDKADVIRLISYLVPKLRHFRCPGINLVPEVTACSLNEPLEALAGDRLSEAMAAASTMTDSFELQLLELGTGDGGSNFNDNLKRFRLF